MLYTFEGQDNVERTTTISTTTISFKLKIPNYSVDKYVQYELFKLLIRLSLSETTHAF